MPKKLTKEELDAQEAQFMQLLAATNLTNPTKLAKELGVSRQRYHILERRFPQVKQARLRLRKEQYDQQLEGKLAKYAGMRRSEFFSDPLREAQQYKLTQKKTNSRGVDFDITWADLDWPTVCPVLGIAIDYYSESGKRNENSCSFDRIDNTKGYVKGNVRVMSWRANRIKNDGTAEEHRKIAEYIDSLQ